MVLHLVDKMHFDTIAPIGKIPNMTNANERILSTSVRLSNMLYTNKFLFQENDIVKRIETFTCNKTKHVRHQELEMEIPSIENTLHMIKSYGFHVKGYATYASYNGDIHQYLYFFEKIDV